MKSKRHEVARRFIDLEARADDSDEEDEELDEGHGASTPVSVCISLLTNTNL